MEAKPLSSRVWPEGGARAEVQPEALGGNNRSNNNSYLTSFDIKRFSTDSFVTFPFDSLNFTKHLPPPTETRTLPVPFCPHLTPDRELWQGGKRGGARSSWQQDPQRSLAGQFAVEAGQADGEGLQSAHGVVVVQGEDVFGHSAELHDDVISCGGGITDICHHRGRGAADRQTEGTHGRCRALSGSF